MRRGHVLCLGARPETLEAARRREIAVVDIQRPGVGALREGQAGVLVDFTQDAELDAVVDALRHEHSIIGAVSMAEAGLVPAARQRERLGLAGHGPKVSETLRDKAAMRAVIANVPSLVRVAARVVTGEPSAIEFAAEVGYPVVVKPVNGAASLGVHAVADETELRVAMAELRSVENDELRPSRLQFDFSGCLLEEFVEGPEYSVECFSFAGRHVVLGVTEKTVGAGFVEHGHTFPARCTPSVRQVLSSATVDFLTTVGVTDGPSHTEMKMTSRGPAVIESHDRPGGDRIVDLVGLATGFDFEEATLSWAVGAMEPLAGPPAGSRAAATAFLSATRGRVQALTGLERAQNVEGVVDVRFLVDEGTFVGVGNGNLDRVAQAVAVATSSARARRAAEASIRALGVRVS